MGLVARELESRGIPTVSLSALRKPTLLVRPPRALFTRNPNSQIVGAPNDRDAQLTVLRSALRLLAEATEPGMLTDR
ncbi:MAG TPA: hypothetical protein VKQ30_13055 [Ktedonobacterales bacterium]|nr:hypothetical protein [Ktedonobacterales bacterium]